jgi:DNA-binding beta-propeller fold protein YncE
MKAAAVLRAQPVRMLLVAALAAACGSGGDARHGAPKAAAEEMAVRGSTTDHGAGCAATATSLTPSRWRSPSIPARSIPTPGLRTVADIPLPGPASRFDYQSVDPAAGRLYISHMNAGRLVVFDLDSGRVVREVDRVPRVTGVWAVPDHHHVYASAAGAHEVAVIDDHSFDIVAHVEGIRFPDGIAYAREADKVFVSDESGESDVVIDAATLRKRSTIGLDGEAGNTHYDSVSKCILVAVQTRGELVAIDPFTERIVARYDVPGVQGPHGFTLDELRRLAFVTGEGNATLAVVDLRTMRTTQRLRVGDDPDVLAWDPEWRRLYVASESGVLSSFWVVGDTLLPLGDLRVPRAHTVSVDPRTHRVYLPLESVGGRPVLRVLEPAS